MDELSTAKPRVLVVEDEYLIRMLVEDMLVDQGYDVTAAVGTIAEARAQAESAAVDIAILDVNLDGEEVFPIADVLVKRGLPFVFVTGYGQASLPDTYRDYAALQKPFKADQLKTMLSTLLAA